MNKFFGKVKLSTKELALLALLTAITAILAMFATLRVGNFIKIPFKFIPIFIIGVFYGPFWAALSAVLGDILNALLLPVGPFMPQITLVEFFSGYIFGLFMYNAHIRQHYFGKMLVCVLLQFALDMLFTSYLLTQAAIFPNYSAALIMRLPAGFLKALLQGVVMCFGKSHLKALTWFIKS